MHTQRLWSLHFPPSASLINIIRAMRETAIYIAYTTIVSLANYHVHVQFTLVHAQVNCGHSHLTQYPEMLSILLSGFDM